MSTERWQHVVETVVLMKSKQSNGQKCIEVWRDVSLIVDSAFVNIDNQAHGNIFDSFALFWPHNSCFGPKTDCISLSINFTNNIQKRYHQIGAFIWQIMQMHALLFYILCIYCRNTVRCHLKWSHVAHIFNYQPTDIFSKTDSINK